MEKQIESGVMDSYVLRALKSARHQPISPQALIRRTNALDKLPRAFRRSDSVEKAFLVKEAMWNLLDQDKAELTVTRKVFIPRKLAA